MTQPIQTGPEDSLRALWQTGAADFDAATIIAGVERQAAFQRTYLRGSIAASLIVFLIIAWFDLEGLFVVPGLMTGALAISIGIMIFQVQRAKRRCPSAANMTPRELLQHALRHAKASLKAARTAYAIVPAAALLGVLAGPFLNAPEADLSGPRWLALCVAGLLCSMVVAGAVWGLRHARSKKREVEILEARIKSFDADL